MIMLPFYGQNTIQKQRTFGMLNILSNEILIHRGWHFFCRIELPTNPGSSLILIDFDNFKFCMGKDDNLNVDQTVVPH